MSKATTSSQLELLALKSANYTDKKVSELCERVADVIEGLEATGDSSAPDYWIDELDAKADAIQAAMEKAGRNKSAFLLNKVILDWQFSKNGV